MTLWIKWHPPHQGWNGYNIQGTDFYEHVFLFAQTTDSNYTSVGAIPLTFFLLIIPHLGWRFRSVLPFTTT